VLIPAHILYLKPEYLPVKRRAQDLNAATESATDANFLIVFHSNYVYILLSFRDMTTR